MEVDGEKEEKEEERREGRGEWDGSGRLGRSQAEAGRSGTETGGSSLHPQRLTGSLLSSFRSSLQRTWRC